MADDPIQVDDAELFELLDRYVAALHAGDGAQCARWLNEYPDLREMAACLDVLDDFSGCRAPGPGVSAAVTPSADDGVEATILAAGAGEAGANNGAPELAG